MFKPTGINVKNYGNAEHICYMAIWSSYISYILVLFVVYAMVLEMCTLQDVKSYIHIVSEN